MVPGTFLPPYSTNFIYLPLRQYVVDAHRAGAKVKLYYTVRHSIPIVVKPRQCPELSRELLTSTMRIRVIIRAYYGATSYLPGA